jgi:hypothetical protein
MHTKHFANCKALMENILKSVLTEQAADWDRALGTKTVKHVHFSVTHYIWGALKTSKKMGSGYRDS